jgi:hypothetical protein
MRASVEAFWEGFGQRAEQSEEVRHLAHAFLKIVLSTLKLKKNIAVDKYLSHNNRAYPSQSGYLRNSKSLGNLMP